ncbi:MAG: hypothetical protein EOO89_29585 [Pedobacter sp.]|jgi:hypothetical protein|nr:MAG: hypothetical protein EOO89_29585 [Pedobacter sp.]
MSLNLNTLSILHKRYEPNTYVELEADGLEMLMFTDNNGHPYKAFICKKGRRAQTGYWVTKISALSDDQIRYIWQKD